MLLPNRELPVESFVCDPPKLKVGAEAAVDAGLSLLPPKANGLLSVELDPPKLNEGAAGLL